MGEGVKKILLVVVVMDTDIAVAVVDDLKEEGVEETGFQKDHNVAMRRRMIHKVHVENQNLHEPDYNSENCKTHLGRCNPNSENTDFPEVVAVEGEDSDQVADQRLTAVVEGMACTTPWTDKA